MIQDLLADERLFNCAGIGFGQQEGYLLQKSLQKLAAEKSATFLRFFGKIRCTQTDYYIAEATVEGGEDAGGDDDDNENAEAKDPDQEEKGTGVNKYTYFVTNSPFAPWKMLPDIAPSHIQAARKIKVLFHGDLERDITVNPFFFGKEKHLLRA
jgi:radial spoke head protein 4A